MMDSCLYVWYACYGSNLFRSRFLYYIHGGEAAGSRVTERGCRDKTIPKEDKPIDIPFPLYFAENSRKWNGGIAFIGLTKDEKNATLGRIYMITKEQFIDVFNQENNIEGISIDFEEVKRNGSKILHKSLYGNMVYIGDFDGLPIFSFTDYRNIDEKQIKTPSYEYLKMLILGLKETYNFTLETIFDYLLRKPGVKGVFTRGDLIKLSTI